MSVGIGERIRALRTERGLSQEEAARRTGVSLGSYGDIERGVTTDPHYSTLRGISHALGVSIERLLQEKPAVPLAKTPEGAGLAGADPSGGFIIDAKVLEDISELWVLPAGQASALLAYLLQTGMLSESDLQEAREEGVRRQLATHE